MLAECCFRLNRQNSLKPCPGKMKGDVRDMRGLIYTSLIAIFLSISWLVRIMVSKSVTRRVESKIDD